MSLQYALLNDTSWQSLAHWQTPDTPFMSFEFWQALSDTGAIGEAAGWLPIYIVIHRVTMDKNHPMDKSAAIDQQSESTDQAEVEISEPVAVMPVFIKAHHRGEFVFDYAWAEAYSRYGIDYYPRLVTSVPYTPITGQRLWLSEGETLSADVITTALAGVDDLAAQVGASSWHVLFATDTLATLTTTLTPEATDLTQALVDNSDLAINISELLPVMERQGCQFLWQNKNLTNGNKPFSDFDDFLSTFRAKKRKTIRAERRKVTEQDIACYRKCGDEISDSDWKAFYHCYVMTYAVRGQQPYLTLEFFTKLADTMPEHIVLAQGVDSRGEIIASSLFLYDNPASEHSTLYGRYWGALADYDSLHFELCYYQGIEFAIEQGLMHFDPGTQGEHKLVRGFIPTTTHSLHRIYDPRFVPAISNFCTEDRLRMAQYRQHAHDALPFNEDNMPSFDPER